MVRGLAIGVEDKVVLIFKALFGGAGFRVQGLGLDSLFF